MPNNWQYYTLQGLLWSFLIGANVWLVWELCKGVLVIMYGGGNCDAT